MEADTIILKTSNMRHAPSERAPHWEKTKGSRLGWTTASLPGPRPLRSDYPRLKRFQTFCIHPVYLISRRFYFQWYTSTVCVYYEQHRHRWIVHCREADRNQKNCTTCRVLQKYKVQSSDLCRRSEFYTHNLPLDMLLELSPLCLGPFAWMLTRRCTPVPRLFHTRLMAETS